MVRSRPTSPSTPPPSLSLSPSSFPALKRSLHSQHCGSCCSSSSSSLVSAMGNHHRRNNVSLSPSQNPDSSQTLEHNFLQQDQNPNEKENVHGEEVVGSDTGNKQESRTPVVIPAEQTTPLKLRTGSDLLLHRSSAEEASRTIAEACTKLLEASWKPVEDSRNLDTEPSKKLLCASEHVPEASRKFDYGTGGSVFVSSSSSSFSAGASTSTVSSSSSAAASTSAMASLISGRQRLQRHWLEVAGKVNIPETWGREHHLQDWVRHGVVEDALRPAGLMNARTALITECQRRRGAPISADIL